MNFASQAELITLAIDILILGVIVFITSKILPGMAIKNIGTAFIVAIVFGILNALFLYGFKYFGLTWLNNQVSQGLFQVIFNAVLLMITRSFVKGLWLKSFWDGILAAFVISFLSMVVHFFTTKGSI
ncbi:MAG: phage holin family protein [Candidatus Melainabacteria bacterium]|jgi:putative membrane protein